MLKLRDRPCRSMEALSRDRTGQGLVIEPAVRVWHVDGVDSSLAHRQGLQRKGILRALFERFYRECRSMDLRYFDGVPGVRLEIGSGASLIKTVYADIITSDVKAPPFLDLVLQAEAMPFPADSVRAIYAINVFHHLRNPRLFFRELLRVLHPGGGVVLIEPFHGPLARVIFKHLHASEGSDPDAPRWEAAGHVGPMSNANHASPTSCSRGTAGSLMKNSPISKS